MDAADEPSRFSGSVSLYSLPRSIILNETQGTPRDYETSGAPKAAKKERKRTKNPNRTIAQHDAPVIFSIVRGSFVTSAGAPHRLCACVKQHVWLASSCSIDDLDDCHGAPGMSDALVSPSVPPETIGLCSRTTLFEILCSSFLLNSSLLNRLYQYSNA
jgi:hypothetical protein